ncbi:hypothetical protein C5B42_06125 [Candidatus Cerribacteria bacterium 'Amazon FNV 2010 28 9']|uniref:Glycogen synthase n=1 Tax=Candidatus Cerribacteria bacterium 'Amazon FNV 2010 28 9' TaxID=2081795 RepID=A0A317JMP3_9BACT|nr:MAG: hypothetical protein C5B42_06125 [Candidatus Cerribacteria bacterium 'Amazon FNV 2010 28 9']
MRILMLSAEVAPFATVGGLSQVLYFLSQSLLKGDHDVRIFTPFHGKIQQKKYRTKILIKDFKIPAQTPIVKTTPYIECKLRIYKTKKPIVYFLENREYYTLRENVFGYGDDHMRFYLMCRGCLEWLLLQKQQNKWFPEVIHVHDWHAAYFIELARKEKRYAQLLESIPILFSVHNFRYQGNMDFSFLPPTTRDRGTEKLAGMFEKKLQHQNALLRGILHADWINTVSPTHAIEVLDAQYGEGLEKVLQRKRAILSGVINGLDTHTFDPSHDPLIGKKYSLTTLEKRRENKKILQKEFGLEEDPNKPLLAFLGRIDKQKGLHLILEILEQLLQETNIQFVILGGGDQQLANEFRLLAQKYPKRIGTHLYANFKLPHKIFAGADMILMPSMFEPGGIVALEALRYGCVPVVRKTGGLSDTVKDFDPAQKTGNGFSFVAPTSTALLIACIRALETYRNTKLWTTVITNAMETDFSWDTSMKEYVKLYKKIIEIRKRQLSPNPNPAFVELK